MNIQIEGKELEHASTHALTEIIAYIPNSVLSKTILKRRGGNITASSFDAGEQVEEKRSAFDTYVQIIDGCAELSIADEKFSLNAGEGIIIPAHARHSFSAEVRFKMVSTIIRSERDDL